MIGHGAPNVIRSLVFPLSAELPHRLRWVLEEFRLIANKVVRAADERGLTGRKTVTAALYRLLSDEHRVYKQYIPAAIGVALSALKNHRRKLRGGLPTTRPILRKLALNMENQSYKLDRAAGILRVPICAGEHIELPLTLSDYHRALLGDPSWSLGNCIITPFKVVVVLRKDPPPQFIPQGALALDTNEDSVDGVLAVGGDARLVSADFLGVRKVQGIHFVKRRKLRKAKARDRRVGRRLLRANGKRERDRVVQRLHIVSKAVVQIAVGHKAAIVLEDLTIHEVKGRSPRTNRRLNSWPRRQLHQQIEYKALAAGAPVFKVHPAWTSRTCPACGERQTKRRRGQKGPRAVFQCQPCGWSLDRQFNAGLNILNSAKAGAPVLAGAVRFQPSALRRDAMNLLCDRPMESAGARGERSGVEVGRSGGDALCASHNVHNITS